VTVFVTNLTIRAMNNKFGVLIARNVSPSVNRFALSGISSTYALGAFSPYGPFTVMRYNMMVWLFGHDIFP
jgi:hypothetical protein